MIGEYSDLLYFLPILIRIAVGVAVIAIFFDYFKRKMAMLIVDAVKDAGADSPENALSTYELEDKSKGFARAAALLLRKYSSLRRYVKSTTDADMISWDDREEKDKNADKSAHGAHYIYKKERKIKRDGNARVREVRKLTGEERWYIVPPPALIGADSEEAERKPVTTRSIPYLLRDGAEPKLASVIIGCVLLIVVGEVAVRYLPTIMDFFVKLAEIKEK